MSRTSAGVVLFNGDGAGRRFLLLHYPSGHWDFVKGGMEDGETGRETAVRETREETGITGVAFVDGFEEWIRYEFQHDGETVCKRVVLYLGSSGTRSVRLSDEHQGFAWMDYESAARRITFENSRIVLEKAHRLLRSV